MVSPLNWLAVVIGVAVAASYAVPGQAGWRRDRGYNGLDEGFVVAHSRFGNGSVSGPVRQVRSGLEVRLPGGTWVGCRASCSETLRVETVDKWENHGAMVGVGTAAGECGVLGCLDLNYRFRD